MRALLAPAVVSMCVSAVAIAAYDRLVRVPRTPRLAVVDVATLFAAAERRATRSVAQPPIGGDANLPIAAATARAAEAFGPALRGALQGIAADCGCTLVATATVFGADSTVPDYTAEAARRLGLEVAR
jgi:hypothetical protein